ncbi:MAG TPA: bifunctional 4-hydroxy-2-oxoglutarate aldolase/2-dehydro-3-deoxy-phosphogluconate aldolase [Bryobacteraceae bacterium]|jgi:2-dehydro-3-deoxyphosphogluconate aldolase/(4S)-4-hydroxy-2-oxoglutarate aldolase|nr:bifunctional 4-hydroxy-2-oxoglutarate aldolase/2-dehydro-3-deoxy-phosphogluconate aldolase [Bryobacteraceae bacterium]
MTREEIRARIEEVGIIPAVRLYSHDDALFAAEAVSSSGIPIVEVTMTVPGAVDVIRELTRQNSEILVGAGTVFRVETARRCLDAGATFLTTPGLDLEIVNFALGRGIVVFPGALTPTEVMAAWKAGSDFVKVFPCSANGGPNYIRSLKAPFSEVPLIASGGVNQTNAIDFIRAGAVALGIGRDLIHQDAIKRRERGWIMELSRRYLNMVKEARSIQKEAKA